MFQIFLIASDHVRFRLLQYAAVDSKKVGLVRTFDRYPIAGELSRHLHTAPDAVFLDFADRAKALGLAAALRADCPDIPITAIINDPEDRSWLADEGIVYTLVYPCTTEDFEFALHVAILSVKTCVNPDLFAFLPAKAGCGCSTIVLNTAAALANRLDRKTLLIEADLRSGVLSWPSTVNLQVPPSRLSGPNRKSTPSHGTAGARPTVNSTSSSATAPFPKLHRVGANITRCSTVPPPAIRRSSWTSRNW